MANLLEKEWMWIQITNTMNHNGEHYVAIPTYSGAPLIPLTIMSNIMNGGGKDENSAVYDVIKVLKEMSMHTFELAKAKGYLKGLSFEDIK